jgi:hypothetical protein
MILDIHKSWAWVAILSNAFAGSWALAAHKITPLRTRALWWFTGVAQFTIFVQVTLGVIMVNKNKLEFPAFHAFYGFVAIMSVAIIYSYRLQLKSRVYLLYGFGGLFLMGLGIRAMLVGQA